MCTMYRGRCRRPDEHRDEPPWSRQTGRLLRRLEALVPRARAVLLPGRRHRRAKPTDLPPLPPEAHTSYGSYPLVGVPVMLS